MAAVRFLSLIIAMLIAHEVHGARLSARAGASAPVVWGGARSADGRFELDATGARGRFLLDGRTLSLARGRVIAFGAAEGADLGADLVVDVVDERGLPVARDRAARVTVGGGKAVLELRATTWDGRPDPGVAAGRTITFEGVALASPSRAPDEVVEVTADGERPVAARVAVDVEDARVDLDLTVTRAGATPLHVRGLDLEGVVVRGVTQSHGRVALAIWGTCDVRDAGGRLIAKDRPVQLYVLPGGVTQLAIDGVVRLRMRDTDLK